MFPELGDPPAWTRDQLEELNARNIEYNGKKYTRYEINQMQRARERSVRRWKKRYLAETEAGVDTTDSAVRLKAARQSLAEFAQATGGRVDSARTSVPNFGRSEGSKAAWAAKKGHTDNSRQNNFQDVSMENVKATKEAVQNVKSFTCDTLDKTAQNQLKNAHRRLLVEGSAQELGVEVGRVFDTSMKPLSKTIVGIDGQIDLPDPDVPYVAIHTHPDCNIFSPGDLKKFVDCRNLQMLTDDCHNGHVFAVEKTNEFDTTIAKTLVYEMNETAEFLKKQYKKDEISGREFIESIDFLVRGCLNELQGYVAKFYE